MSAGERQLAGLAAALMGNAAKLTAAERRLVSSALRVDAHEIAQARAEILSGGDPLGTKFCFLRSPATRRAQGATYTPRAIVDAMLAWAATGGEPVRIVDPGTGSGRFLTAAAAAFPKARLIAVDIDPLATLMARANAKVLGFSRRLTVYLADYRELELSPVNGPTLFIGNPPYVRHHAIAERWKTWFAATAQRHGFTASKLAGLHIHFFLKTRDLARPGDYGAFITAAEWLDVNYGSLLRRMLADGLGGSAVHIIDPKAQPFTDALTTGAITCFRVGNRPDALTLRAVNSLDDLAPLGQGRAVGWNEIAAAPKWSVFVREQPRAPAGFIELGELFRVHRGQVTGSNAVWVECDVAPPIPQRFKPLAVTSARELFAAMGDLSPTARLKRVIDLPADLDALLNSEERHAVQRFLKWARALGADQSYTARHRKSWWSVGLREPAPVLCTYMARRAPAFVRNSVKARHLNIAHGLYPRGPLPEPTLAAVLHYLRHHAGTTGGRVYAGGLIKFEPRELERILLPSLEMLHGYLAETKDAPDDLDARSAPRRRGRGESRIPQ